MCNKNHCLLLSSQAIALAQCLSYALNPMLSIYSKDIFIARDTQQTKGSSLALPKFHISQGRALIYFHWKPFGFTSVNAGNYCIKKTLSLAEEIHRDFCLAFWSE